MAKYLRRPLSFRLRRKPKKGECGAILFLAVGALVILSILTLGATSSVLMQLKLVKSLTESNTLSYIASSVISVMRIILPNDQTPGLITLYDLRSRELPFGEHIALVAVSDEQGKVNMDRISKEVLLRLPGLSEQEKLVDAIVAANISVKEELLLFDGMTQEIYDQFKNLVTIFGSGSVNINTAAEDTFSILGMDSDLIDKIQLFRAGEDAEEQTQDDQYFSNTTQIIPNLEPYGLNQNQRILLETLIGSGQLGVNSDYIVLDISVKKTNKPLRFFKIVLNVPSGAVVSWGEE